MVGTTNYRYYNQLQTKYIFQIEKNDAEKEPKE